MKKFTLCLLALSFLTGCTSSENDTDVTHPESPTPDNSANELAQVGSGLDGPWADEFKRALDRTENEKVKAILADGIITAAERSEIQEDFRKCGKPLGILGAHFHPNRGASIAFSDELFADDSEDRDTQIARADDYEALCNEESGVAIIEELYYRAGSNPQNGDTSAAVVQCFKDEGIVEDSYTVEDFKLDARTGSFPLIPIKNPLIIEDETIGYTTYDEHYFASVCEEDPFGHLGLRDYDWSQQPDVH